MGFDDWMDLNGDGEVDDFEREVGDELLCSSREEHQQLFGYDDPSGEFSSDYHVDEDEEMESEIFDAGLDLSDLEDMDEEERIEALEDAGLDADDYDDLF